MTSLRLGLILITLLGGPARADDSNLPSPELLEILKTSQAVNTPEIIEDLGLLKQSSNPALANPYDSSHVDEIQAWFAQYDSDPSVCAVKFLDDSKTQYEIQTFASTEDALSAGFVVTHTRACGACSTLQDLAVYIEYRDLTTPIRDCGTRLLKRQVRKCIQKSVPFTPLCAQAWTHNVMNTKRECLRTCIEDYGILNMIFGFYKKFPNNLPDGSLRPCIQCDEDRSGPGFKYSAGRTRRNSGIVSEIDHDQSEISIVDHTLY